MWTEVNYHSSPQKLQVSHMWTELNYHSSPQKLQVSHMWTELNYHRSPWKVQVSHMWTALNYHRSPWKLQVSNMWTALNYHRSLCKLQYHISELRSIIIVQHENFDITYLNCAKLSSFTTKTSISDMWNGLNYHRSLWKLRYHISELR